MANIMKDRPNCGACRHVMDCMGVGVAPFDEECVLDSTVSYNKIEASPI